MKNYFKKLLSPISKGILALGLATATGSSFAEEGNPEVQDYKPSPIVSCYNNTRTQVGETLANTLDQLEREATLPVRLAYGDTMDKQVLTGQLSEKDLLDILIIKKYEADGYKKQLLATLSVHMGKSAVQKFTNQLHRDTSTTSKTDIECQDPDIDIEKIIQVFSTGHDVEGESVIEKYFPLDNYEEYLDLYNQIIEYTNKNKVPQEVLLSVNTYILNIMEQKVIDFFPDDIISSKEDLNYFISEIEPYYVGTESLFYMLNILKTPSFTDNIHLIAFAPHGDNEVDIQTYTAAYFLTQDDLTES